MLITHFISLFYLRCPFTLVEADLATILFALLVFVVKFLCGGSSLPLEMELEWVELSPKDMERFIGYNGR